VPPIGDTPVYLPVDEHPSWSPDGSKIIYKHDGIIKIFEGGAFQTDPNSRGLWVTDTNGSNQHLFMRGEIEDADWSPDGQWLVMNYNRQIFKVHLTGNGFDTSSITQLGLPGISSFFPTWSPDGQWIAYDVSFPQGYDGSWVMKTDGSQDHRIFEMAFPAWSPDSKRLIGVHGTNSTSIWTRFIIVYLDSSKSNDTLSAIIGNNNLHPRYSPKGTQIAFSSQPEGGQVNLWLMDSAGNHPKQLTTNGIWESFCWSPDGRMIAYISYAYNKYDPKNNGTLWIMNADGTNKHQLTYGPIPI